jgi:hypothetical protein
MGIGKCSDTELDLYWCINKNQDDVDCEDKQGVLFFPGKLEKSHRSVPTRSKYDRETCS